MKTTSLLIALTFVSSLVLAADAPKPAAPADLTPPADATRSATGLYTKQLAAGSGKATPNESDLVKLRYALWTSEGKLVDAIAAPKVALLPLARMMGGLREAVLSMKEGDMVRIWMPENLGAMGRVPKGGMLVGDVELVAIVHPPVTPPSVGAPPADATTTRSGLAYKILKPGTGKKHPRDSDYVRVNYSGWTADGKLFDSTILRGNPAELGLNAVIDGWREGMQLMTEGEVMRMWIPARLAYGRQPGKPQGMLVFDIELLAIE
jgi:peptidylprolyl isomerase